MNSPFLRFPHQISNLEIAFTQVCFVVLFNFKFIHFHTGRIQGHINILYKDPKLFLTRYLLEWNIRILPRISRKIQIRFVMIRNVYFWLSAVFTGQTFLGLPGLQTQCSFHIRIRIKNKTVLGRIHRFKKIWMCCCYRIQGPKECGCS